MSRRLATAVATAAIAASLLLAAATDALATPQSQGGASAKTSNTKAKAATSTKAKRSTTKRSTTKRSTTRRTSTSKRTTPAKRAAATATRKRAPKPAPAFASLWPVKGPDPLPGSILPHKRIVAYYGNPLSRRMGVLGEYEVNEMLRRLDREVAAWERADTLTPVVPALHLIATVAQGSPGRDGKWRARMSDSLIERVYRWAERRNALLFLDVQVAHSSLRDELPPLAKFLARPNVHLGIDPEFAMKGKHRPGTRIGSYDARDVNYAMDFLADLVDEHKLPPKVLVIHRFTRPMLTNSSKIALDPRVQVVIHMDGWGSASLKKGSYDSYVASEPVQFTGFKLFYKNDVKKKGWRLMKPAEVLALTPKPVYIQYQ